jgi:NhaA family Na+:H+ antiporter
MRYHPASPHGHAHHAAHVAAHGQPVVGRPPIHQVASTTAVRLWHFVMDRFLLLPLGAVVAMVWANTAAESYFRFSHRLSFVVNEIAMAFFLALIAQEVLEAVMPGGALHHWRRWGTTIVAAAGGILGTTVVYLLYVNLKYELVLEMAWPVACAIDIAAGYYVLKLIFRRSSALPFLLMIAVVTNIFGFIVVALRPPYVDVRPGGIVLMLAALAIGVAMRRFKVRPFWPYIVICGGLSWWALYLEGMHPALALVPIVPLLPHEPRRLNLFADPKDDDEVHHFEHEWNEAVQAVLFFFGLVNAGVMLRGYGTGTWATLTAALVGRPVGILAAILIAVALGMHLPRRIGWRELLVVALATTSGFTFALFFATGLIPIGPLLAEIKLGALGTAAGALVAIGVARLLRVGRFGQ